MANTLKFGNGQWATGNGTALAYNDENSNFKPLPFDFTRASSGTTVNQSGLIETVSSGIPRIDFKGNTKGALLLEPSRTNLITYSEDFSNAIWTNSNAATIVNPTANLSPDGTLSGNEFNEGNADARRGLFEDLTVTANTSYTLSVFVKKGTSDYLRLVIANGLNSGLDWTAIQVDLSNNSVSAKNGTSSLFTDMSSSISNTNFNGYYRLQLTAKHPTTTTLRIVLGMSDGVAIASTNSIARRDYVGANKYLYVWGCQLEQGTYATSYIPTSGSAVTRVAETCSQTVPDGVIGQTEGVLFGEFSTDANDNNSNWINLSDGTSNNWLFIGKDFTNVRAYLKSNGVVIFSNQSTALADNNKVALSYKSGNIKVYINGVQILSISSSFTFSSALNQLNFGAYNGGVTSSEASWKQLKLYNTILTDNELAALTQV